MDSKHPLDQLIQICKTDKGLKNAIIVLKRELLRRKQVRASKKYLSSVTSSTR